MPGWLFRTLTVIVAAVGISAEMFLPIAAATQPPPKRTIDAPKWTGPPCDTCAALPRLEKELFEQEWLQRAFEEYARGKKSVLPPAGNEDFAQAMVDEITGRFTTHLNSPAGGGGGKGSAALATNTSAPCTIKMPVKYGSKPPVMEPLNERDFKAAVGCDPIADMLITHEKQHVADCTDMTNSPMYQNHHAAFDVRAYSAGIKQLRAYIAKLATDTCGWQGSTNDTRPDAAGNPVKTVPTPADAQNLAKVKAKMLSNTLKKGARR